LQSVQTGAPAGATAQPHTVSPGGAAGNPTQAVPPSPAATGSAAAQALRVIQEPQFLLSLVSAALGQHGRQQVGGIPVAQALATASEVMGEAARDADEMMYLDALDDDVERLIDSSVESGRSLYSGVINADNLDLSTVPGYEGTR
jgi:hypothetical protein